MTIIVTRDVAPRFRGFLASCMLELAPGVYTAPRMNQRVREQVWNVLAEWFGEIGGGAIIMTWQDSAAPAGQSVAVLGVPPISLVDYDGIVLSLRATKVTESMPDAP